MSPPDQMDALVVRVSDDTPSLVIESIPTPKPGDYQILVKVSHVAQNPTDVQSFDGNVFGDGAVLGCDFVGVVEEIGPRVTQITNGITKGTVVAGLIWGGEIKGLGGYSQCTLAEAHACFPVPSGMSLAEAATLPLASTTAFLSLFSKSCLGINTTVAENDAVLIWGAGSSVGLYAVQLAKLRGLEVIATCSPRYNDLVKSYGAAQVFDYHYLGVVEQIRKAAPNIRFALDTIGTILSSSGAGSAINHLMASSALVTDVLVWTAFLKEHYYGPFYWPLMQADYLLAGEWFKELPGRLSSGEIKPNTAKVSKKGLKGVSKGFQEYRDGKILDYKIVYEL